MLRWIKQKLAKYDGVVGVDIGETAIKLLAVKQLQGTYQVEGYGLVPLPSGAVHEKEIKDHAAVTAAIRTAINNSGIRNTNAVIAIPDAVVVSKIIQLDAALSDQEMEEQIMLTSEQLISYPVEEVNLDFQVLGLNAKNSEFADVLLLVTRQQNIISRVNTLAAAGLTVKIVEAESHAIARASAFLYPKQILAVVDIGTASISLTILDKDQIAFNRSEALIDQTKETVMLQIRRILQFFLSANHTIQIQGLALVGGGSLSRDLALYIQDQINISTFIADPFKNIKPRDDKDSTLLMGNAPRFLLSCGLALRCPLE